MVVKRTSRKRPPIFEKFKIDEKYKGVEASHEGEIVATKEKIGGATTSKHELDSCQVLTILMHHLVS